MNRIHLAAVITFTCVVGLVVVITVTVSTVLGNGTQRQANCLDAGGSYLRVANTTGMECRR